MPCRPNPIAKAPIVRFFDALERPILRQKEIGGFLAEHRTEWGLNTSLKR